MDEMIDDALRTDELPPRRAFFRYDVMRRVRGEATTPPLRFPWRAAAALGAVGAVAGAFIDVQQWTLATTVLIAVALSASASGILDRARRSGHRRGS